MLLTSIFSTAVPKEQVPYLPEIMTDLNNYYYYLLLLRVKHIGIHGIEYRLDVS